jgi:hypothetical protein
MDKIESEKEESAALGDVVPFDNWLKSIGRARVTGWKLRKSGAVKTINIFGRLYITRSEIARFEARAVAGEFVRHVASPPRKHKSKHVGLIDRLIGRKSKTPEG